MHFLLPILQELPGWILVTMGFYIAYRVLKFPDLTVDASFLAGTAATAYAAANWNSSLIGLVFALLIGGVAGLATSLVYLSNPKPSFKLVAGVFVIFSAYSLNYRLLGQRSDLGFSNSKTFMNELSKYQANIGLNTLRPLTLLIGIVIVLLTLYFFIKLFKTNYGIALRAVGVRSRLVSPSRFSRKMYLLSGLVICNAIVGIGGWYVSSVNCFSDVRAFGTIIHALAAAILGEIIYERFNLGKDKRVSLFFLVFAPIVGTIIYQAVRAGTFWYLRDESNGIQGTIISINQYDSNMIVAGALLLTVVCVRYLSEKFSRRRSYFGDTDSGEI